MRQEKQNHIVTAVKKKVRKEKKEREKSVYQQPGKYRDGVLYLDPKLLDRN